MCEGFQRQSGDVGSQSAMLTTEVILVISAGQLSPGSYNISLVVGSLGGSDMLSTSTSCVLSLVNQPIPEISLSMNVGGSTSGTNLINLNTKLVVSGVIRSAMPALATWHVSGIADELLSAVATTPTSQSLSGGVSLVQLSIPANQLALQTSYTITLTASVADPALLSSVFRSTSTFSSTTSTSIAPPGTLSASTSLLVTVNMPPQGGYLAVSPHHGTAMNTSFVWSTYLWSDENLPLTYSMWYYPSGATTSSMSLSSSPQNLVKSGDFTSTVTSLIGPGLMGSKYQVNCVATATDVMGASAQAGTAIIVRPISVDLSAVAHTLESSLMRSSTLQDPSTAVQIVNVVLGVINSVNCSAVHVNCA
jgi:hypothetical protein